MQYKKCTLDKIIPLVDEIIFCQTEKTSMSKKHFVLFFPHIFSGKGFSATYKVIPQHDKKILHGLNKHIKMREGNVLTTLAVTLIQLFG